MRAFTLWLLAAVSVGLVGGRAADITLANGLTLKDARIVALGKDTATVVHAGGSATVPQAQLDLEVLARASMELADKTAERKKVNDEVAQRAAARSAEQKEKREEEIQIRLAMANAREKAQGGEAVPMPVRTTGAVQKLAALKAKFPGMRKDTVVGRRGDKYEISVPALDVWNHYRSMIQTTTIEALPVTLKRIEERLTHDEAELSKRGSRNDLTANTQAHKSLEWFSNQLRPYLAQLAELQN